MTTRGRIAAVLSLLLALSWNSPTRAGEDGTPGVRITYLANEGFLLETGDTQVLIDALFGSGLPNYLVVPAAIRADLEGARGRFAGVDLILASHSHADHFDAAAVARHLRANPAATFLSTEEAVAEVREELGEQAQRLNLVAAHPDRGESTSFELAGVALRVLNLHHGRLPVPNHGLIVSVGGVDVLHAGDSSADASDLGPYAEPLEEVDVWLLPDWLMGAADWEAARGRAAGPTWLVNMHLAAPGAPPDWFGSARSHERRIELILEELPDTWIPVEPLESRFYPAPSPWPAIGDSEADPSPQTEAGGGAQG